MSDTQARIEELEKHLKSTQGQLEELKKQLEAEQKPKLRHGDCFVQGGSQVVITHSKREWGMQYSDGSCRYGSKYDITSLLCTCNYTYTNNIFDDLKAMQEDVEEFEFTEVDPRDPLRIELKNSGEIRMTIRNNTLCVYEEEIPKFKLVIGQMYATLKRKQAKK